MSKLHGMHYTTCDKSYDNLLSLNNNDASGHRKHMQFLAAKLYKSFESLNPISRDDSLLFHDGDHYHYRNQSIDLLCKSVDWFLYDNDLRHERVNINPIQYELRKGNIHKYQFSKINIIMD